MIIKSITDAGYVFQRDDGSEIVLSYMDVNCITMLLDQQTLRSIISDIVDDYSGDMLSFDGADITREDFEEEVFESMKDRLERGVPEYDEVTETVLDTADDYGLCI